MSLFAELKRRSVFKVGAAYLVVGWLVIQVAATLAPQMGLPEWAPRFVSLIVMLGFPVALVLAWVFDITPEGLKVETAPLGNKRMFAIAAILFAAALGWYWKGGPTGEGGGNSARSIAVLPFVNMSGDPANEYFSDGISEEILNVLARTPELSVAARTSSFAYKDKTQDIPGIARELKVRMVLEGSVRKQGERVRITAQLIDAETGFHAWSQTYDRDLKDIFAIQDEIAKAIGNELKVRVGGAAGVDASVSGTTDLEAHDLYLRGLTLWQMRRGDKLWEAVATLERAVGKDPGYAEAYGGLALVYAVLADYSTKISYEVALARSTDAAEMALAIDPGQAEAYAALGNVAISERRRSTAHALYRRAIALKPSFATAYQWLGTSLMSAGEPVEGLVASERATALDPRSLVVGQNHAIALQALGRYDEGRAVCERVLAFAPDYVPCLSQIGLGELMRDQLEAARPFLARATANEPGALPQVNRVIDALAGHGDKHAVALEIAAGNSRSYLEPGTTHAFAPSETPWLLVKLGEPKLALDYIDKVLGEDGAVPEWAMVVPAFDPVRCEPRTIALFARLKAKDARFAQVCGAAAPAKAGS